MSLYKNEDLYNEFKELGVISTSQLDQAYEDAEDQKIGVKVIPYYSTKRNITNGLNLYAKDVEEVFDTMIEESLRKVKGTLAPEPSIIKIVDMIIQYAYQNSASD